MSHIIIFIDKHKDLSRMHVIRDGQSGCIGPPKAFSSREQAEGWAERCLGNKPYQIIDTDKFMTANENV